jgi:hypothetical protein
VGLTDDRQAIGDAPPDDWLAVSRAELEERRRRLAEPEVYSVPLLEPRTPAQSADGQPESPDQPPQQYAVQLNYVAQLGESLAPHDRMRLIARLWKSLPAELWPALDDRQKSVARRRMIETSERWMDPVPWPVVERMLADRFAPKTYSVPRRFDLATLFIVTLAYSLLFALMGSLQFPPAASVAAGAFITIVGAAQAVLYGGRRPRAASIWTGAVLYCIPVLAGLIGAGPMALAGGSFFFIAMQACMGGFLGYIAGTCVGGVFLLADVARRRFRRDEEQADDAAASPFDRSMIDSHANSIESPPPNPLWQFLFDPHDASKLFSAPRRFDLATIFVITATLSLLFGFLSVVDRGLELGLQPGMTIVAGGLLTAVAIGQAWFFGQANPRGVSVIIGSITFTLFTIILCWIYPWMFSAAWLFVVLFCGVIGGAFLGYIAGVLVGGMFLVADLLRRKFSRTATDHDEDPFAEFDPPPAGRDIDTTESRER